MKKMFSYISVSTYLSLHLVSLLPHPPFPLPPPLTTSPSYHSPCSSPSLFIPCPYQLPIPLAFPFPPLSSLCRASLFPLSRFFPPHFLYTVTHFCLIFLFLYFFSHFPLHSFVIPLLSFFYPFFSLLISSFLFLLFPLSFLLFLPSF